jgi:hypothetical protein
MRGEQGTSGLLQVASQTCMAAIVYFVQSMSIETFENESERLNCGYLKSNG